VPIFRSVMGYGQVRFSAKSKNVRIVNILLPEVLEWVEGLYEEQVFTGDSLIISTVLGDLALTIDRVLQGC
jgi:hypothetical protein